MIMGQSSDGMNLKDCAHKKTIENFCGEINGDVVNSYNPYNSQHFAYAEHIGALSR